MSTFCLLWNQAVGAWGFESKNSDWDVRFIYTHKPEWYFTVGEPKDHIEYVDAKYDLDMVGWDIKKALAQFRRMNPTLSEWLHSPSVYLDKCNFYRLMSEVEPHYFNPIKTMYHYYRIYINTDERYLQRKECSMKYFLYYLRGTLACKWIEKRGTMPPVKFSELVSGTIEDAIVKEQIDELITMKRDGNEHDMTAVKPELLQYAKELAEYYHTKVGEYRPKLEKYHGTQEIGPLFYHFVCDSSK